VVNFGGHFPYPLLCDAHTVYTFKTLVNSIYTIYIATMGRIKHWDIRILLSLTMETVERLDAVRADDEGRLDVIRAAIERELKRRERQ
jgi:hypothetical protein